MSYKLVKQTDASTYEPLYSYGGDSLTIYWADDANNIPPGNIGICANTGVPYNEATDGVYLVLIGIKADSSSDTITGEIRVKIQFTLGSTLTCSESIMWDSSLLTTEYTEPYMGVSLD